MKRLFTTLFVLAAVFGLMAASGLAAAPVKCEDPVGVVTIKPGEPIHIACWMVVAGPDASLGTDPKIGVEVAIDDKGGKLLGHPIKLSVQDTGCNAEGGQAAATKLAADQGRSAGDVQSLK